MLKIERTSIVGRFNLIDDDKPICDDDRWIRQMDAKELRDLATSILNATVGWE